MNFLNNPEYSSLKVVIFFGFLVLAGGFIFANGSNSGLLARIFSNQNEQKTSATGDVRGEPSCIINVFTAYPVQIPAGTSSTLSWNTSSCTSTSIAPVIGPVTPVIAGSVSTGVLTQSTTFTLTAIGANTVTKVVVVDVIPKLTQGSGSGTFQNGTLGTGTIQGSTGGLSSFCTHPGTWTQKADFGGGARVDMASFSIGNKGYTGIGYVNSHMKKDFWEYDPINNTWTQKADFGGVARDGALSFSIGNKGYIGTGWDDSGNNLNDFWEYDPINNTWTQKADFGGGSFHEVVGFAINGKGYAGTGWDGSGVGGISDFWEYDPINNTWTQKADFGGGIRTATFGLSIGDKGYIGAGWDGVVNSGNFFNDFWEYNPQNNTWTQKADFPGTAHIGPVGFSIDNKGYIGTGSEDGANKLKEFWEYNPNTDTWTQRADFGGGERRFVTAFSVGGKGYMGTGSGNNLFYSKDFWEYCPTLDND